MANIAEMEFLQGQRLSTGSVFDLGIIDNE